MALIKNKAISVYYLVNLLLLTSAPGEVSLLFHIRSNFLSVFFHPAPYFF